MDRLDRKIDSLRVLHIDDDQTQLQLLSIIFGHLDPSVMVESCESPHDAIKKIAENGFDCIVSDYIMPGMTGIELAEKTLSMKNIPFILYTGQGSEEVAQKAFSVGVNMYIRKEIEPSHYEVLLNSIKQAVTKHRAEQIYEALLESNPEPILVVQDNVIQLVNSAALSLFNEQNEDSLIGKRFIDYIDGVDQDELTWMSLKRIVSENKVIPFEYTINVKNEKKRVVGNLRNILYMGDASQIFFLKDVTSIRQIESSHLVLTHSFEKLFELSPSGVALLTLSGEIVKSNQSFNQLMGTNGKEGPVKLLHEPEFYQRILGRAMESNSINFDYTFDFTSLTNNGYLVSSRNDHLSARVIISPITGVNSNLFLIQIST